MTRPIYEPNDQRAIRKNRWGVNQLERRPSPVSAQSQINYSAFADANGLQTRTVPADVNPLRNEQLWMTPGGPYEPDTGDATSFDYLMVLDDGWYRADFYIYWSTDFGPATFPRIRPGLVADGAEDFFDAYWNDPQFWPGYDDNKSWIGGEQFTAAEQDHHSLEATVFFNLSFAMAGLTTFGIGNTLDSTFSGSKDIGGYMTIERISDYMEPYGT